MTPRLTYKCKVDDTGKIVIPNRERFAKEVATAFKGKTIILEVRKATKERSLAQLRYYWGVVVVLIYEALRELNGSNEGFDRETVHQFLKDQFLPTAAEGVRPQIVLFGGEVKELAYSTRYLTTVQFMAYIQLIQKWAAEELWVTIPDPYEPFDDVEKIDIDQDF